jgi:mannan endo-1,4-beta-mannosidase
MRYIAPLLLLSSNALAAAVERKAPKDFVTREGGVFRLDGKNFYFAGSNAYYFPFNDVRPSKQQTGSY